MLHALRRPWIPLLVAALGLVGACRSDQERFEEHLTESDAYQAAGELREALIELRSALKLQPQNALVNERIADLYREQGAFEEAVFFYREAQRLDPTRIEAILAEIPLIVGSDRERAGELVEDALERAPSNPIVHQRKAELELIRGDTAAALAAALTAVELAPEEPGAHHTLGVVRQAQIREYRLRDESPPEALFESAIAAFDRAAAGDERRVEAYLERARTLAGWSGHAEEATEAFRAVLERAVEAGQPQYQLAAAEQALQRARRVGDRALERASLEAITALDLEGLGKLPGVAQGVEQRWLAAWRGLAELGESAREGGGEAVLQRLLEERPADPAVHRLYARFLRARGRADDALAHLEQSAEQASDPPVLLEDAVRMALAEGRGADAHRLVARLEAEYAEHPRTLRAGARLALARGRAQQAAELLGRVNELEESAESQALLGLAELRRGDLRAAIQAVDRSLQLQPRRADTLRIKARAHHRAGDWPVVLQALQRLRQVAGRLGDEDRLQMVQPLYELGRARAGRALLEAMLQAERPATAAVLAYARHEGANQPEKAMQALEQALARTPRSLQLLRTASVLDVRAGKVDRALERVEGVLASGPAAPGLRLLHARLLARAGKLAEAESEARQVFSESPNLPGAMELLLRLYRVQDKLDEAIAQLEQSELDGPRGARYRALLGQLYLSRGDSDRARAMYEAALAEDPELAFAKNDLAFLLARNGEDLDRALRLAQEALQQIGEDPAVADTLGYVFLRKGLAAPAAEHLHAAVSLAAEQGRARPVFLYHLGLALRELGRDAEAADAFSRALEGGADFPDLEDARRQLEEARTAAAATDAPPAP